MTGLVHAPLRCKSEFSASPCSWTGNQQDGKHRNNNQQTQMLKAGGHILDKVKRVSGWRVKERLEVDVKVQRAEGRPPGSAFCLTWSHPAPPPSELRMMRKQSEHMISTTQRALFRQRTIPTSLAGPVIKGVCPWTRESGSSPTRNQNLTLQKCLKRSLQPSHLGLG